MLPAFDPRLLGRPHGDLPLTDTPFADVAAELGSSEALVLERLQTLLADGTLTRFGPLFQIERAGGLFVLAAMDVPEERYAAVTAQVNALPARARSECVVCAGHRNPGAGAARHRAHRSRHRFAGAGLSQRARVFCRTQTAPDRSRPWPWMILTAR